MWNNFTFMLRLRETLASIQGLPEINHCFDIWHKRCIFAFIDGAVISRPTVVLPITLQAASHVISIYS